MGLQAPAGPTKSVPGYRKQTRDCLEKIYFARISI